MTVHMFVLITGPCFLRETNIMEIFVINVTYKLFECVSANLAENKPQDEFVQNFNFSESFGIVNIISASVYIYTNLGINNNIALYRH